MVRPKIGLALGAGAARGHAHVAIIESLIENGINVDYVAGTSVGSMVAAYFALKGDVEGLKDKLLKMKKKDYISLIDLAKPTEGMIKGNKIEKFLDDLFEGKKFSDTKIPLRIIATDIIKGKEKIFSKGKISQAVRASISIPGIFVPKKIGNNLYVDGGVMNNTPVDIVKSMGSDIVIGVDLPFVNISKGEKHNSVDLLMNSFELMRKNTIDSKKYDHIIMISPKFGKDFTGYRFYESKRFMDIGKKEAEKNIRKIKYHIGMIKNQ